MFAGQSLVRVPATLQDGRDRDLRCELANDVEVATYSGHRPVPSAGSIAGIQIRLWIDCARRRERLTLANEAASVLPRPQAQYLTEASVLKNTGEDRVTARASSQVANHPA